MRLRGSLRWALLAGLVLAAADPAGAQDLCAGTAPVPGAQLSSFPVVTGLTGRPLLVTAPPGDRDRLFVLEQDGRIQIHHRGDPPGTWTTFLDISALVLAHVERNEMGLLGLAFDTDYDASGYFYVNYTGGPFLGPWFTAVSRFSRSATDPDAADPASEVRLLTFDQPESNHNGGQLLFDAQGLLLVATGDGGGGGDGHGLCGNGQDLTTLLGKFLRLDVRERDPLSVPPDCGGPAGIYRVPSGNPFALAGTSACGEIWTYGLRNPWRSSIDPVTGDLYIGDVGQICYEEIDVLPALSQAGANLGWRSMEATHCYDNNTAACDPPPVTCGGTPICHDPSLVLPVLEFDHNEGCSVVGGPVYRGCQMPEWRGTYYYGDYCAGFVRSFRYADGSVQDPADHTLAVDPAGTLMFYFTSFGLDGHGEVYLVSRQGTVRRMGPRFIDLEVSGAGDADPFLLGPAAWTWGDLAFSSMRPVSYYRVYRGTPGGSFVCRFTTTDRNWIGGDPETPAPGTCFTYVVTAVSPAGEETRPGVAGTFALGSCP